MALAVLLSSAGVGAETTKRRAVEFYQYASINRHGDVVLLGPAPRSQARKLPRYYVATYDRHRRLTEAVRLADGVEEWGIRYTYTGDDPYPDVQEESRAGVVESRIEMERDAAGRKRTGRQLGPDGAVTATLTWAYTDTGFRFRKAAADGSTLVEEHYLFDQLGRWIALARRAGNTAVIMLVDPDTGLEYRTEQRSSAGDVLGFATIERGADGAIAARLVFNAAGEQISAQRYDGGKLVEEQATDGRRWVHRYDKRGRRQTVDYYDATKLVARFHYKRDAAGNVVATIAKKPNGEEILTFPYAEVWHLE